MAASADFFSLAMNLLRFCGLFKQTPGDPGSLIHIHYHDTVAHRDHPTIQYAGGNPAMSAYGVIAAGTEGFFHQRTWMTFSGVFHHCVPNGEALAFQCQQIDPAYDNVPAQCQRIDFIAPQIARDRNKMFGLKQGNLAQSVMACPVMISFESFSCLREHGIDYVYRRTPRRANADPDDIAWLHLCVEQFKERRLAIQHDWWKVRAL